MRRPFFRGAGTAHQLHLTRADSRLWRERIAFRAALRDAPGLRDEYNSLKQVLSCETDLAAYTRGKPLCQVGGDALRGAPVAQAKHNRA